MNATVYVNGHKVGTHPYGYTAFSFDITDYVKVGEVNTIAVKVDHKLHPAAGIQEVVFTEVYI